MSKGALKDWPGEEEEGRRGLRNHCYIGLVLVLLELELSGLSEDDEEAKCRAMALALSFAFGFRLGRACLLGLK